MGKSRKFAYKIFQAPAQYPWVFRGYDECDNLSQEAYKEVYLNWDGIKAKTEMDALNKLFFIWNQPDRPCGQTARSLSVSDVIELVDMDNGEESVWYVDDIGFERLSQDVWTISILRATNIGYVDPENSERVLETQFDTVNEQELKNLWWQFCLEDVWWLSASEKSDAMLNKDAKSSKQKQEEIANKWWDFCIETGKITYVEDVKLFPNGDGPTS